MKTYSLTLIVMTALLGVSAVHAQAPEARGPRQGGEKGPRRPGMEQAERGPGGPGPHTPPWLERLLDNPELAEKLGITPEEIKEWRKQKLQHEKRTVKLEAAVEEARLDLRELMRDRDAAEADLMQAVEAVSKAELALRKHRVRGMLQARAAIGEERAQKMREMAHAAAKGRWNREDPPANDDEPKPERPRRPRRPRPPADEAAE
ncbi:MAG: hypothetical protein K9N49_10240 [Candidatus Marinimicrobia bacterium]|nr:hypothetical protein [Candidatus Neomarinimicrobiota bacterium]